MGGKTPSTFAEGLLSGLGHPVIGPDHLQAGAINDVGKGRINALHLRTQHSG